MTVDRSARRDRLPVPARSARASTSIAVYPELGRLARARPARLTYPASTRVYSPLMRAVTFQAPGEVRVDDGPSPSLIAPDDAVVQVEATGICGSDLHIYHGRVKIEPGLHDRPRVRRNRGRGRRRGHARRRSATACSAASTPPAGRASSACAATTTSATTARVFGHGATLGVAPGRAGRAGAGPAREPGAAPRARGDGRRRRAVRRRRDGHRLPRGRRGRDAAGRHRRGARPRARSGCARCRSRRRRAPPR